MKKQFRQLRLKFMAPLDIRTQMDPDFHEAYHLWERVWRELRAEMLQAKEDVKSDDFSRQSEIMGIFRGKICIGLLLHRYVDLRWEGLKKDSYFSKWDQAILSKLTLGPPRLMICSYLTGGRQGKELFLNSEFSLKHVIIDLMAIRLLESGCERMGAVSRRAKGIHDILYSMNGECLLRDVPFHNPEDKVDFVVTLAENIKRIELRGLTDLVNSLWEEREDFKSSKNLPRKTMGAA